MYLIAFGYREEATEWLVNASKASRLDLSETPRFVIVVAAWLLIALVVFGWRFWRRYRVESARTERVRGLLRELADGVRWRSEAVRVMRANDQEGHKVMIEGAMEWSRGLEVRLASDAPAKDAYEAARAARVDIQAVDWGWQRQWIPTIDGQCARLAHAIRALEKEPGHA